MKIFGCGLILLFLCSCATVTSETKNKISTEGYAGYWVSYKNTFGDKTKRTVENYVQITCDGNFKYEINQPYALIFKKDTDDTSIMEFKDGMVSLKSWIGLKYKYSISRPEQESNGCYAIRFKGNTFRTYYREDCSKPRQNALELLDQAFARARDKDYVYCD